MGHWHWAEGGGEEHGSLELSPLLARSISSFLSPPTEFLFFLFFFKIMLVFNCRYQQPLNNDFIYILNLGQLNAKQNADTFLCLNWMKVTAITTFNWAIFHYHILMTLHWQFACFWGRSMMESFISLFSYCLTTSASIKTLLYRTLIIFEWASGISVNTHLPSRCRRARVPTWKLATHKLGCHCLPA